LITTKFVLLISFACPLEDVSIERCGSSSVFNFDKAGEGWVLRRYLGGPWRRMCWLPHKRRSNGVIRASFGQQIVICAVGGVLTILDFSNV
jgi:hypothetical protein